MDIIYLALGIVFIVVGILTLYLLDKARFNMDGPIKSIFYLVVDVLRIIIDFIRSFSQENKHLSRKYSNQFSKIGIFLLFLIGIIFIRFGL
jgi:prolipoprotein diacylglyceryltransferase